MNEFLPYLMDIVVIFIFVLQLAKGWHKGLARTVVALFSWLLAIVIAWQLYGYVADLFRSMGMQAKLAASFGAKLQIPAQPGVSEAAGFIGSLGLPETLTSSMIGNNNYEAYTALGVSSFGDYVGVFLANIVINALAVLLVFIISFFLLRLVARWLGAINHIPILGLANRILGMVAGGIIGYCMIQIWMFIFTMLATGQNIFATLVLAIEKSQVAVLFFHHNQLVDWIMKIFV